MNFKVIQGLFENMNQFNNTCTNNGRTSRGKTLRLNQ